MKEANFDFLSLSIENYDNALIQWSTLTLQPDVTLYAAGLKFCKGKEARQKLIDDFGWKITGDAAADKGTCAVLNVKNSI